MIALTLLLYFGLSNIEKATAWRTSKAKYLHLFSAIVLIGLGIAMLIGWI
jgi:hypothetical protein